MNVERLKPNRWEKIKDEDLLQEEKRESSLWANLNVHPQLHRAWTRDLLFGHTNTQDAPDWPCRRWWRSCGSGRETFTSHWAAEIHRPLRGNAPSTSSSAEFIEWLLFLFLTIKICRFSCFNFDQILENVTLNACRLYKWLLLEFYLLIAPRGKKRYLNLNKTYQKHITVYDFTKKNKLKLNKFSSWGQQWFVSSLPASSCVWALSFRHNSLKKRNIASEIILSGGANFSRINI